MEKPITTDDALITLIRALQNRLAGAGDAYFMRDEIERLTPLRILPGRERL